MSETSTLIGYGGRTVGREQLALVPTPAPTETHRPLPHYEIVRALIETLGFRHIGVVLDEYAVSPDGMKMFGVLDLATEMEGGRFSIGVRNSHDKSMRLAMTCGLSRVRVLEHGVLGRLYSGARETLEVVLAHRLHFGWSGSDATELRADAESRSRRGNGAS